MSRTAFTAKLAMASRLSMVAAMVTVLPASADMVTTNGVTWTYITNEDGENTVTLGPGGGSGDNATDEQRAIPVATKVSASLIPWKFEKEGKAYTVTRVNARAFYRCTGLTGTLTIPDSVKEVGAYAFTGIGESITRVTSLGGITKVGDGAFHGLSPRGDFPDIYNITSFGTSAFRDWTKIDGQATVTLNPSLKTVTAYMLQNSPISSVKIPRSVTKVSYGAFKQTKLTGLMIPGPLTAATSDDYTEVDPSGLLQNAWWAKVFFAGPNTKASTINGSEMFGSTGDLKAFIPDNEQWEGDLNEGGNNTEIIKYGPGREIDFEIDTDEMVITAIPTTTDMFVNALNWSTLFKEKLGYQTRISVTNSIEVSEGTVTAEMLSNVQLNSTLMMFAVKTQAQLDSVLAAVPQTTMLAIDPTGAKEELNIPQDRAMWVWLSGTGKYKPYIKGLILSFR
jgi:hypothetical protein